jgi:hypothetical protein
MSFGYLTREYKTNTAASGFCRVERNEGIAGIHQSWTAIFDGEDYVSLGQLPAEDHLLAGFTGKGIL